MPEHDCLPPDVSASDFVVHMAGCPACGASRPASGRPTCCATSASTRSATGRWAATRPGMKQRAKLAQALAHDPQLVFLDEPTNGLDPAARNDMLGLVQRIGSDFGIAVLVTSHLLGELEQVSDHVIVLDGGRLLRSATGDFLNATGTLLVEVVGEDARRPAGEALAAAGLPVHPRGGLLAIDPPPPSWRRTPTTWSATSRPTSGVGLMRLQPDRRHLEDVFADG